MSENTKIEWTDHSWNPWRGCTKVSDGCKNCYAETLSKRNPAVLGQWGKGKPRVLAKNWNDPVRWQKAFVNAGGAHHGATKPTIFPSLCDWLDEEVPVEWLARFLKLIHETPNLTWLLLTKRPENFRGRMIYAVSRAAGDHTLRRWAGEWIDGKSSPSNVWIGTSVEDQSNADRRIPELLKIPAVRRFLSLEPLLGPVDLVSDIQHHSHPLHKSSPINCIDWLIIGGESGRGARPCHVDWIRSLVKQGKEAGVATFVKQLGAVAVEHQSDEWGVPLGNLRICGGHPKGGDPAEWPEDLRVREFPEGLR